MIRLYTDEGFDSTKSVYTAKLKELTDLGNPVEARLYETNNRQVQQYLSMRLCLRQQYLHLNVSRLCF